METRPSWSIEATRYKAYIIGLDRGSSELGDQLPVWIMYNTKKFQTLTWMPEAGTTKLDWQWLIEIDWADILLIIVTIKQNFVWKYRIHFFLLWEWQRENLIKNGWRVELFGRTSSESSQPIATLPYLSCNRKLN